MVCGSGSDRRVYVRVGGGVLTEKEDGGGAYLLKEEKEGALTEGEKESATNMHSNISLTI